LGCIHRWLQPRPHLIADQFSLRDFAHPKLPSSFAQRVQIIREHCLGPEGRRLIWPPSENVTGLDHRREYDLYTSAFVREAAEENPASAAARLALLDNAPVLPTKEEVDDLAASCDAWSASVRPPDMRARCFATRTNFCHLLPLVPKLHLGMCLDPEAELRPALPS
ncbi:MAG: hypothetical protein P4L99_15595, partial [Chthoniobacter sp.]|nr:hypothetical protein [Chthoniobacter sp.]